MELYKVVLRAAASYVSPLQSDTFFGAFCWSYRYLYGEEALELLLKDGNDGNVPIIFSNAFPSGYLPSPLGSFDETRDRRLIKTKEEKHQNYQDNKRLKSCNLLSKEYFLSVAQGKTAGFSAGLSKETAVSAEIMHNTVSRTLGTTSAEIDGGGLYTVTQHFNNGKLYDLYILTSLNRDVVLNVLKQMLQLGIGGKKSIGNGYFLLEEGPELCSELLKCQGANAFVALSNFIPAESDPTDGAYKTFVKNGKLDREFASTEYPFKKPLLFIESGAVFLSDQPKQFYGRCIKGVSVNPKVTVNACTIAIPIVWKGGSK